MSIQRGDPYLQEAVDYLEQHYEQYHHLRDERDRVCEAWGSLTSADQKWIDLEIERCVTERRYYLENYHVIRTEYEGMKTLFPFWDSQEIFYSKIIELEVRGRQVKVLVLKARQLGLSTISEGIIFHKTLFTEAAYSLIVASDGDKSDHLFGMSRLAYDNLPWWMRPEVRYDRKGKYMIFDREDPEDRRAHPGLNSGILVEAANKMTGVAVGKTIRAAHLSELAEWTDPRVLSTQIWPAMNAPDAICILESTARGRKNVWHDLWEQAVEGELENWSTVFIEFFRVKKYSLPIEPEKKFQLTKEETAMRENIAKVSGVTISDEQFNWRREKIKETIAIHGDEFMFYQEYPSATWREAFQGSGLCAFDKRKLQQMLEVYCTPPVWYGECDLQLMDGKKQVKRPKLRLNYYDPKNPTCPPPPPTTKYGGRLRIWRKPQAGYTYIVSGDVAHGIRGGDFSCAQVLRKGKGPEPDEQVAEWHGWINATPYGAVLAALGYWYNNAIIAVECNDIGRDTQNELMRVIEYENLFRWKKYDKVSGFMTDFLGWITNSKTRPSLINKMREAIDDSTLVLRSGELVDECLDFAQSEMGAKFEGQDGHDDRTMSMMIARFCLHDVDWADVALSRGTVLEDEPMRDPSLDYQNTDFSPIHDRPGSLRHSLATRDKIPAEAVHEAAMYGNMGTPSGEVADEEEWKKF